MARSVHLKDLGKDRHTSNGQDVFKYVNLAHCDARFTDNTETADQPDRFPSLTAVSPRRRTRTSKHIKNSVLASCLSFLSVNPTTPIDHPMEIKVFQSHYGQITWRFP